MGIFSFLFLLPLFLLILLLGTSKDSLLLLGAASAGLAVTEDGR